MEHPIVLTGLGVYLALMLAVGLYASRRISDSADFIVAGKRLSLDLAMLFITETSLEPLQVEYRFSLPLINVMTGEVLHDLELVGVIDLIDHPNGKSRAVEIKTKAKKPNDFTARTSIELTCYAYWLRFLDDVESIPVSYANIIKIKKPYLHWQDQERGPQDFVDLYHTIKTVAGNIAEGRFYRNPGVHCNWCDYKPVCTNDMKTVDEIFGHEAVETLTRGDLTGNFLQAACG